MSPQIRTEKMGVSDGCYPVTIRGGAPWLLSRMKSQRDISFASISPDPRLKLTGGKGKPQTPLAMMVSLPQEPCGPQAWPYLGLPWDSWLKSVTCSASTSAEAPGTKLLWSPLQLLSLPCVTLVSLQPPQPCFPNPRCLSQGSIWLSGW